MPAVNFKQKELTAQKSTPAAGARKAPIMDEPLAVCTGKRQGFAACAGGFAEDFRRVIASQSL
jgi:hypothetical protein